MKKVLQYIGFILAGLLAFQLLVIAPQSLNSPGTYESDKESLPLDRQKNSSGTGQSMTGVRLVESGGSGREWELNSEKAFTEKSGKSWKLEGVKAQFFGVDGTVFDVKGKTGTVYLESKDMQIGGDVEVKSSNGYTFFVETINYSAKEKHLISNSEVQMFGPKQKREDGLSLNGIGLVFDLNQTSMKILDKVNAQKRMAKGNELIKITSVQAEFSSIDNTAKFSQNVVIDYETMRLTGPEAVFSYDKNGKQLNSLSVAGGVKVSDKDKWATSKLVTVDFKKNKYVFKGSPKLVQNNDELRGDEIIFFDGGNRVKVKNTSTNFKSENLDL